MEQLFSEIKTGVNKMQRDTRFVIVKQKISSNFKYVAVRRLITLFNQKDSC